MRPPNCVCEKTEAHGGWIVTFRGESGTRWCERQRQDLVSQVSAGSKINPRKSTETESTLVVAGAREGENGK